MRQDRASTTRPVFRVSTDTGILEPALQQPCPNRDARPAGAEPSLVVLHGISLPPGRFGGQEIASLFANTLDFDAHPYFREIRGLRVSAHLLIRRLLCDPTGLR